MSTKTKILKETAQRLKANYPQYEIVQTVDSLVVNLPLGKIEVTGSHLTVYLLGEMFDEMDFKNSDELYEGIEQFILMLQEEEKDCNPTFTGAIKNAQKRFRRGLYIAAAVVALMMVLSGVFEMPGLFVLTVVLVPLLALIPMRIACKNSFKRDWVCPHCGAKLPMKAKLIPWAQPVPSCPQCGQSLLDKEMVEKLKEEVFSEDENEESEEFSYETEIPKRGGKKFCKVSGIVLIVYALLLGIIGFLGVENPDFLATVINAVTLLTVAAMGAALIFCHEPETENVSTPKIVVRERKLVQGVGIAAGIIGLVLVFMSVAGSAVEPVPIGSITLLSVAGIFLVVLGAWMCLARKNRAVYIYSSAVTYVSSFGRKREIECAQIASVKVSASGTIKFLNQAGKKLFSIENNMLGAEGAIDWIDRQKFPINTTKTFEKQVQKSQNEGVLSWHEEDRTPMHNHLKAIRAGLVIVMLLFAAGIIVPILLYICTDIKITHEIYMICFSPLPLVLYYLIFAPVLTPDYPEGATEEWKAMHVKFPVTPASAISLLAGAEVYYFWESVIFQVADSGRFILFVAVVAAVLIALFYVRTPKRLRSEDGFVVIILSLLMISLMITYGLNLAISRPAEHYPAVVVERIDSTSTYHSTDKALTVLLDDGKEVDLNVIDQVYNLEKSGVEFVVCQKENFLGIRTVRLHLPEGTDLSELLKQYGETP